MYPPLRLRALTDEETRVIGKLVRSQTASVQFVQRAHVVQLASRRVRRFRRLRQNSGCAPNVVRKWFKRFEAQGLAGLEDAPQLGALLHGREQSAVWRPRSRLRAISA